MMKGYFLKKFSSKKAGLYYVLDYNTLSENIRCNISPYLRSLIVKGIDVVQLRAKGQSEAVVKSLVEQLLPICREEGGIFILNDFVEIAIQSGCDGVHIGQDDMSPRKVRQLSKQLPHFIVGVTVGTRNEALCAQIEGADYLGTVSVFHSVTKSYENSEITLKDLSNILDCLLIPLFCIGGLNEALCDSIMSYVPNVSGFCFVSRIQGAESPVIAVQQLRKHIDQYQIQTSKKSKYIEDFLSNSVRSLGQTQPVTPLVLHYTNEVVIQFTANVCLSLSASPIMSKDISEAEELVAVADAVVINIGTLKETDDPLFLLAVNSAIKLGKLLVLDPVAYSASHLRRDTVKMLMARYLQSRNKTSRFLLKGNLGEVMNVINDILGETNEICAMTKGTDSVTPDTRNYATIASRLRKASTTWQIHIIATGWVDYVSSPDGAVYYISNGSSMLQKITGGGCILSSVVSIFATRFGALPNCDPFGAVTLGCILGTAFQGIAGEIAEEKLRQATNGGMGSFLCHLQDSISLLSMEEVLSKIRLTLDPLN